MASSTPLRSPRERETMSEPSTKITAETVAEWDNGEWADALRAARNDLMMVEDFEPSDIAHVMECAAVKLLSVPAEPEGAREAEYPTEAWADVMEEYGREGRGYRWLWEQAATLLAHPEASPPAVTGELNLRIVELIQDDLNAHSNPESPFYNDCKPDDLCSWCDEALEILAALSRASPAVTERGDAGRPENYKEIQRGFENG